MDFQTYLALSAEEIHQEMIEHLVLLGTRGTGIYPQFKKLITLFISSAVDGKCLRGTLVKLGYTLGTPGAEGKICTVAAAYEILHTSILIHDDIIDQSRLRRGKPTIHHALGDNNYGTSQSICLGDIGFFLANKLIAESAFSSSAKIVSLLSQIITDTFFGEMLDIELTSNSILRNEKDVLSMQRFKTAQYTIAGPLLIGAELGNVSAEVLSAIRMFGEYIGIAFQIQDDILGMFGNEQITGKSSYSDIEEGKNTLLITFALGHASAAQKKLLLEYYGKGKLENGKYEMIKMTIQETGALTYSHAKAKRYVTRGKKIIPQLTSDKTLQRYLTDFADFIIERQK
jgi:geranylgeranyl diphosphate synthase, type I